MIVSYSIVSLTSTLLLFYRLDYLGWCCQWYWGRAFTVWWLTYWL